MTIKQIKKIYQSFKTAARGVLARVGIDTRDPLRYGNPYTALEKNTLDLYISNPNHSDHDPNYAGYNESVIVIISTALACRFRERRKQDEAFLAKHLADPEKYPLDIDKAYNPFRNYQEGDSKVIPLSEDEPITYNDDELDEVEGVLQSNLSMREKLNELRGIEGLCLMRHLQEKHLSRAAKEKNNEAANNGPVKRKIVPFARDRLTQKTQMLQHLKDSGAILMRPRTVLPEALRPVAGRKGLVLAGGPLRVLAR